MVRKGFLEKGHKSDTAERGTNAFVRVTWDQALDLVARELKRVKAEFGPASFYVGDLGWKSSGRMQNPRAALAALMNLHGGYSAPLGDYSTGAAQAIMPRVMGNLEVYAPQSAWPGTVEACELLVVWGADPMVTLNIGYAPPDHQGFLAFKAFKDKGTPTVVIDPKKTETATYLGGKWIAPRPGSDTAIMLALAHTLYSEKLHNEKFLKEYTVGFDQFVPYLTGASDGVAKDAAWAAKIAGIEADAIKDLARQMAKKRTFIVAGWALQRAENGEQAYWALVTLASMLGQIGLPGGGFSVGYHYSSSCAPQATSAAARRPDRRQGARQDAAAHPVRPHRRHAAQSRTGDRLQRPQDQIPGRPHDPVGRRQSVQPSPGPQPADQGVAQARGRRGSGAVLDDDGALRRHRAAGDDLVRAQRHRAVRRLFAPVHRADAQGGRAGRRGPQRLRHRRRRSPSASATVRNSAASPTWR